MISKTKARKATRGTALAALAVAFVGPAAGAAADFSGLAALVARADRSQRASVGAKLRDAGALIGAKVAAGGVAYASSPERTVAGALVVDPKSLSEVRAGAPLMMWYFEKRGTRPSVGIYTASLEPSGAAVLKDGAGVPFARGTASLKFAGGTSGYCEFNPHGDDVCLECSSPGHDDIGGPISWSFCFTLP
jgi:hypothetical protein